MSHEVSLRVPTQVPQGPRHGFCVWASGFSDEAVFQEMASHSEMEERAQHRVCSHWVPLGGAVENSLGRTDVKAVC